MTWRDECALWQVKSHAASRVASRLHPLRPLHHWPSTSSLKLTVSTHVEGPKYPYLLIFHSKICLEMLRMKFLQDLEGWLGDWLVVPYDLLSPQWAVGRSLGWSSIHSLIHQKISRPESVWIYYFTVGRYAYWRAESRPRSSNVFLRFIRLPRCPEKGMT